jgi:hypothetical protein
MDEPNNIGIPVQLMDEIKNELKHSFSASYVG